MIVEDEPPILREINSIILSFPENYHVIKCCYNGYDALQFLETNYDSVDILLTDIHLPVVDGLELLESVSQNYPHILGIILSGYGDFEYAQKALKLRVYDYLLKPIDETELHNVLKRSYEKKCIENIMPDNSIHSGSYLSDASNLSHYYLSYICLGSYPCNTYRYSETMDKKWKKIDEDHFQKIFSETRNTYWLIKGSSSSERTLLVSTTEKNFLNLYHTLNKLIKELTDKIPITIVTINEPVNIHNISSYIQQLQNDLQKNIRFAKSQLLCDPSDSVCNIDMSRFYAKIDKLVALFQSKNIALFENELQSCLRLMQKNALTQSLIQRLLDLLFTQCFSLCVPKINKEKEPICTPVNDLLYLSTSYEALYRKLKVHFTELFQMLSEENDNNNKQMILLRIDHYIKEHYKDPINTKLIADYFNFTPAYLSKIFREYKNVSPADYITTLRIEKAKELLSCSNSLSIKDIAAYIGYEDSLYFSKVFKKYTGYSPKKFQTDNSHILNSSIDK